MAHLYITTDEFEAETLIEDTDINQEPKYDYTDIDSERGTELERKLGFNPMCVVNFGEISKERIGTIAGNLVKQGLFVAIESNGKTETYKPKDIPYRNKLLTLSQQVDGNAIRRVTDNGWGVFGSTFMMGYANDLCGIKQFKDLEIGARN